MERPSAVIGVSGGASGITPGAPYEHNPRLQAYPDRIEKFCRAWTHWSVAAAIKSWRGLCEVATWAVKPGDDSPEAEAYAQHASECIGLADNPIGMQWETVLRQALHANVLGFAWWETVPRFARGKWYTPLAHRDQRSLWRWVTDDDGAIVAVEQLPIMRGGMRTIPAEQLHIHINGSLTADDHTGDAMMRPISALYDDAMTASKALVVALDRWAVPTPRPRINEEVAQRYGYSITPEWASTEITKAAAILRDLKNGTRTVLGLAPWIDVEFVGGDVTQLADVNAVIQSTDQRILSVAGAEYKALGTMGSGGAYALSASQMEAQADEAQSTCNTVCRRFAPHLANCVRWQFGEVPAEKLPKLTADGLSSQAFVKYLSVLPSLVASDLLRVDDGVRDALRSAAELPAEDANNRPKGARVKVSPIPAGGIPIPNLGGG